jgi:predicted RNA binding protein YcfA (HicA-like mRNA interferase family)
MPSRPPAVSDPMTGKTDNHENISSSAVIAALKRRGYKVVDYTINVYVFKSHDPEGYCVTLPGDGETLSAKMVRNILKHEPVNADEVVSESLEQMDNDKPLVIDVAEAMRVIKSTNFKKANRTPEQLKRIHATMKRIKSAPKDVTGITDASVNLDDYIYDPHPDD